MAQGTGIGWTQATWNPIAGCNNVSEGCRNCYARTMAGRLEAMGSNKYKGITVLQGERRVWTGKVVFDEKALLSPLKRKVPTMYFVNSMSDLYHPNVTDEMRDKIRAVQAITPQHTYQVLTKRPAEMLKYESGDWGNCVASILVDWFADGTITTAQFMAKEHRLTAPLPNVWLGVSVENQAAADERIPLLLQTPAAKRFISAEPLLGSVSLKPFLEFQHEDDIGVMNPDQSSYGARFAHDPWVRGLDWVICGGESGKGHRRCKIEWITKLAEDCKREGVAVFVKQDYGARSGMQGRIPDNIWAMKEWPKC